MAKIIAERSELNADEVENLMFKCEDIIYGEPTNKKEGLEITSRLRVIEETLGIKRTRAMRKQQLCFHLKTQQQLLLKHLCLLPL